MKLLHVLAVGFLLAALLLYFASSTTGAWILGGVGLALEAAAWIIALTSKNSSVPSSKAH